MLATEIAQPVATSPALAEPLGEMDPDVPVADASIVRRILEALGEAPLASPTLRGVAAERAASFGDDVR